MWEKLEKLAEQYDCWHLWQIVRKEGETTTIRCKKCGKVKEVHL